MCVVRTSTCGAAGSRISGQILRSSLKSMDRRIPAPQLRNMGDDTVGGRGWGGRGEAEAGVSLWRT